MTLLDNVREQLKIEKAKQEEMKKLFGREYNYEDSEYVFVDALGNLIEPDKVTEQFGNFTKKNMKKRITLHGLRHSCATAMLSTKTPMKLIQAWLGHSDMGTTANTYSHVDSRSMEEAAYAIYGILIQGISINGIDAKDDEEN